MFLLAILVMVLSIVSKIGQMVYPNEVLRTLTVVLPFMAAILFASIAGREYERAEWGKAERLSASPVPKFASMMVGALSMLGIVSFLTYR